MSEAVQPDQVEKIVKVTMLGSGFDPAHGKMRKGGVYEFPMEQATRLVRLHAARPAPKTAKTAREEDREVMLQDAHLRAEVEDMDQAMSAAWDVDIRDVERAELEAEDAEEAAEAATVAVKRAQSARKLVSAAPSSSPPGLVQSQGER